MLLVQRFDYGARRIELYYHPQTHHFQARVQISRTRHIFAASVSGVVSGPLEISSCRQEGRKWHVRFKKKPLYSIFLEYTHSMDRGRTLNLQKQYEQARKTFLGLLQHPLSFSLSALAYEGIAMSYLLNRNYPQAIVYLNLAKAMLLKDPDAPLILKERLTRNLSIAQRAIRARA